MRILVTGSRRFDDEAYVRRVFSHLSDECMLTIVVIEEGVTVVHGAARGLDSIADKVAKERGWGTEPHPADWNQYGKRAGMLRNSYMAKAGADICLAFPDKDSIGTWDMIRKAVAAGIQTRIYPVK